MKNNPADLYQIDEALMTYDLSDEEGGEGRATIGYCATAGTVWYCLPY